MRLRRRIRRRRLRKRGRGIPYIFKNKVYLGKRPQKGSGQYLKLQLEYQKTQETLSEFKDKKKKKIQKKKYRLRKKYKRDRGIGDGFKFLYSIGKQWRKSMR